MSKTKKIVSILILVVFFFQVQSEAVDILEVQNYKALQINSFFKKDIGVKETQTVMEQIRRTFHDIGRIDLCLEPVINGVKLTVDFQSKFHEKNKTFVPCCAVIGKNTSFFNLIIGQTNEFFYKKITEKEYEQQRSLSIINRKDSTVNATDRVPDKVSILEQAKYHMNRIADEMKLDQNLREKIFAPEKVTTVSFVLEMENGEKIKFWGFRALQNNARGAGKGGLRWLIATGETLEEAKDTAVGLATLMTVKNATVGIPYGGGKGDVFVPFRDYTDKDKAKIMRAFSRELTLKDAVGTFIDVPAPDKGTDARMMAWFVEEHIKVLCQKGQLHDKSLEKRFLLFLENLVQNAEDLYGQEAVDMDFDSPLLTPLLDYAMKLLQEDDKGKYFLPELGVVTGKPVGKGGSLGRTEATGYGGYLAFNAVREALLDDVSGQILEQYNEQTQDVIKRGTRELTVGVQGTGNVGEYNIRSLYADGAKIVLLQDVSFEKDGNGKVQVIPYTLYMPNGLNLAVFDSFMPHRKDGRWPELKTLPKEFFEIHKGAKLIKGDTDFFWEEHTNVKVAGATENQIFASNANKVNCEILLELANCPTTPEADDILKERGLLVIPDVLANVGGVTVSFFEWLQNLEGKYWTLLGVNKMLEERIYNEVEDVLLVAKKYGLSLRDASFRLSLSRVADAEIARDRDLQRFFRYNLPYEGYTMLGLTPETFEGLDMLTKKGLYQSLIDKEESRHEKYFINETEKIVNKFNGEGGFVMISGPQSGGKIQVAQRFADKLAKKGLDPIFIDIDLETRKMENILREQGIEEHLVHQASVKVIKQLLQDLNNGREVEIFVNKTVGKHTYETEKIRKKENSVFIIEGDLALDDELVSPQDGLLKDHNTYSVFVNVASSLKVTDNWALTSLDLRLIRQILTEVNYYGEDALETIQKWPLARQVNLDYTYPAWKNADSTFNSYLGHELPIVKSFIEDILNETLVKAKEQKDAQSIRTIEHLLHILRDVVVANGRIPGNSIIRQCIGSEDTTGAKSNTFLVDIVDGINTYEPVKGKSVKGIIEFAVDIKDALYLTSEARSLVNVKEQVDIVRKKLLKLKAEIFKGTKGRSSKDMEDVDDAIVLIDKVGNALKTGSFSKKIKDLEKILLECREQYSNEIVKEQHDYQMPIEESLFVLHNDVEYKHMVSLPVIQASTMTAVERSKARAALDKWFKHRGGTKPEHVPHINDIDMFLRTNDKRLEDVFFVISEDLKNIEAFSDLATQEPYQVSVMETAPWNRSVNHVCKYKGVGNQIRVFSIKKLYQIYGEELFKEPLIGRIFTLGHRKTGKGSVFDHKTATKKDIEAYIKQQEAMSYTHRLFFGKKVFPGKVLNSERSFFDDYDDPEWLYKNMLELVSSVVLSGKQLVLTTDKNLAGEEAVRIKKLMKKLREWAETMAKKDPCLCSVFRNIHVFEYNDPSEVRKICEKKGIELSDKDKNMVFSFSSQYKAKDFKDDSGYIRAVYLDLKEFDVLNCYVPLFEIVLLSVTKEFKQYDISDIKEIFKKSRTKLKDININDIIYSKDGSLIFYLIPKVQRYDHNSKVDRYQGIIAILSAA